MANSTVPLLSHQAFGGIDCIAGVDDRLTFGEIAEFVRVNGVASWLAALDDIQDLIVFYLSVQPFGEQDDEND